MAEYYLRLIPKVVGYIPEKELSKEIKKIIDDKSFLYEEYSYIQTKDVEFVDCGGDLETIKCNYCDSDLSLWWEDAMNITALDKFSNLEVVTPCCQNKSSLDELIYDKQVGFSRLIIELKNMSDKISMEIINEIL